MIGESRDGRGSAVWPWVRSHIDSGAKYSRQHPPEGAVPDILACHVSCNRITIAQQNIGIILAVQSCTRSNHPPAPNVEPMMPHLSVRRTQTRWDGMASQRHQAAHAQMMTFTKCIMEDHESAKAPSLCLIGCPADSNCHNDATVLWVGFR